MLSGEGIVKLEYPFAGNRHYGISGRRVTSYEWVYNLCPLPDAIPNENEIKMKPMTR